MPNKWRTIIKSLRHEILLHGRRGKGTAESFSREKLRQAPQKERGEILCDLPGKKKGSVAFSLSTLRNMMCCVRFQGT